LKIRDTRNSWIIFENPNSHTQPMDNF